MRLSEITDKDLPLLQTIELGKFSLRGQFENECSLKMRSVMK